MEKNADLVKPLEDNADLKNLWMIMQTFWFLEDNADHMDLWRIMRT
jgi:hypothetical protein